MTGFIQEFALLILITVIVSYVVKLIKQPIIVGYVLGGVIFSIIAADGSSTGEYVVIISELGITLLLFLMGLEFDLQHLKYLGKDVFLTTLMQSGIFFGIGYGLAALFGFPLTESIYLAILFMFSSTLLVAKWIDDKKESNTLHGKLTLGILLVQDILAIAALTFLNVLKADSLLSVLIIPLGGIALLLISFLFATYFLNDLFKATIRYPELLFTVSLGICFMFVELAPLMGYSTTIGAFIAGVTIANTIYKTDVHSRLKPLILFFNMLFFVGMGFQIELDVDKKLIGFMACFVAASIFFKPVIGYLTMKLRGYDYKTSMLVGLNLGQLSEFGIIIVAAGIAQGSIGEALNAIVILMIIITMLLSSYLIKNDSAIATWFMPHLQNVDRMFKSKSSSSEGLENSGDYDIIFIDYAELDADMYNRLKILGKKILVIDNDPENIEHFEKNNIPYLYNSISNPYFFHDINLEHAELIISGSLDTAENKMLLKHVKEINSECKVIIMAKSIKDSLELYDHGATYVVYPNYINQQHVTLLVDDYATDVNRLITKKVADISKLKEMEKRKIPENFVSDIDTFVKNISQKEK